MYFIHEVLRNMSLMLVYFETGKSVDIALPASPIVSYPARVILRIDAPEKPCYVLTDGLSSERFLAYGKKVVGREGERLRKSFVEFVAKRLTVGVCPHFIFVVLSGAVGDPISLTIEAQIDARFLALKHIFSSLKPNQLVRVKNTEY